MKIIIYRHWAMMMWLHLTSWGDKFSKTKEEAIRKDRGAIQPLTENERGWYILQTAVIETAKRLMRHSKEAA